MSVMYSSILNRPCTAVSVLYQGCVCSPALRTPPVSGCWDARADLSLPYISPYYISRPCLSVSAILILCCRFQQSFPNKDGAEVTVLPLTGKEGLGMKNEAPMQPRLGSKNKMRAQ